MGTKKAKPPEDTPKRRGAFKGVRERIEKLQAASSLSRRNQRAHGVIPRALVLEGEFATQFQKMMPPLAFAGRAA